jgi:hypothetical protein
LPCAFKATGAAISAGPLSASRNEIVPVGVGPPACVGVTVTVNVTACPAVEGFTEDTMAKLVPAPVAVVAIPLTPMLCGLPGAEVDTNTCPPVANPGLTSAVGANFTLIAHEPPAASVPGQLLVAV